jgi:hypothetical protein
MTSSPRTPHSSHEHAGEDVRSQTTWVQEPTDAGTYFIEVEALGPSEETLAHEKSRDFRVGRA